MRSALWLLAGFTVGIVTGGYLFSRTIPRSFLAVSNCGQSCYKPNDIAGLLASAGIHSLPTFIPTEHESIECLAIKHPKPEGRVHFVLFPKRDIRNIMEIQPEDGPYVLGCFTLARQIAQAENVLNYRLLTNGPALQHVTYLHFHLIAK